MCETPIGSNVSGGTQQTKSRALPVPRVFLYGDAGGDQDEDLLHIEEISTRSGANDWIIRPHAHPLHVQILLVTEKGGWLKVEEEEFDIRAPSLTVIPAGLVHQIAFQPHTDGLVITASTSGLSAMTYHESRLITQLTVPLSFTLDTKRAETEALTQSFERLMREFVWHEPARRTAMQACLLQILVALLRLRESIRPRLSPAQTKNYELIVRYRRVIEDHFRQKRSLNFFAQELGVTTARLNAACRAMADTSAARLLHERLIIEAKRYLAYTGMSISEIAATLGFNDAAYFNRFFAQRVGQSPGTFRAKAISRSTT